MNTKSAVIIAVAIVAAVALYLYFSPYQSCVRNSTTSDPALICASALGGRR